MEDVELNHIITILNQTGWQVQVKNGAAKILDINVGTPRTRMAKLRIYRKSVQLN